MSSPTILDRLTALADPMRCRVLLVLERHELTVGELGAVLQLPQSTTSRHLKTLADEGWLACRAEGTARRYTLARLAPAVRTLWTVVREELGESPAARHDAERLLAVLAERRTKSRAFFSGAAGEWDRLRGELFGARPDLAALPALLDDAWTVGDLGCGTGQLAAALAPFVQRVIAVDESAEMLAAAAERFSAAPNNVELRRGELEALPVADGELDAAVCALVLHHVAEPGRVLAEARRALVPGGRLLVIDMLPHDREEYHQQMGHVWPGFGEAQLALWLADAGFERVRFRALAADPQAKGPTLFVAGARAPLVSDLAGSSDTDALRAASISVRGAPPNGKVPVRAAPDAIESPPRGPKTRTA